MVDLAKTVEKERDEIRGRLGYKKILDPCEQAKRDKYEWCGSILAVSISETAQRCIGGMETPRYAIHTSTMSMGPPFPLGKTMKSITS